MISLRSIFNGPSIITLYIVLAIVSSTIWLYCFNVQIFEPSSQDEPAPHTHRTLLLLMLTYALHLPVMITLAFVSRPWLWKNNDRISEISKFVLGWDNKSYYCLIGGVRAVASFLAAWAPFNFATKPSSFSLAGIIALTIEGFFVSEMVKHTEAEMGFFIAQIASALCAGQRLYGVDSKAWKSVMWVCICSIVLRSVLPYYEDVDRLLPDPGLVDEPKEPGSDADVIEGAGGSAAEGATAQPSSDQAVSSQTEAATVVSKEPADNKV